MATPKRKITTNKKVSASMPAPGKGKNTCRSKASKQAVRPVSKVVECRHRANSYPIPAISDVQLVAMYDKHIDQVVCSMGRSYSLSIDDVADLKQECFMKLLSIATDKRPHPQLVKTIINNIARDRLRQLQRYARRNLVGAAEGTFNEILVDSQAQAIESSHLVDTLFKALSPIQKKLVTLHLGMGGDKPMTDTARLAQAVGLSSSDAEAELATAMATMRGMVAS